jgi:hypothetical protein
VADCWSRRSVGVGEEWWWERRGGGRGEVVGEEIVRGGWSGSRAAAAAAAAWAWAEDLVEGTQKRHTRGKDSGPQAGFRPPRQQQHHCYLFAALTRQNNTVPGLITKNMPPLPIAWAAPWFRQHRRGGRRPTAHPPPPALDARPARRRDASASPLCALTIGAPTHRNPLSSPPPFTLHPCGSLQLAWDLRERLHAVMPLPPYLEVCTDPAYRTARYPPCERNITTEQHLQEEPRSLSVGWLLLWAVAAISPPCLCLRGPARPSSPRQMRWCDGTRWNAVDGMVGREKRGQQTVDTGDGATPDT